jgi:hypothetical protein
MPSIKTPPLFSDVSVSDVSVSMIRSIATQLFNLQTAKSSHSQPSLGSRSPMFENRRKQLETTLLSRIPATFPAKTPDASIPLAQTLPPGVRRQLAKTLLDSTVATLPASETFRPTVVILRTTAVCAVDAYHEDIPNALAFLRKTDATHLPLTPTGLRSVGPTRKPLARRALRQSGDHWPERRAAIRQGELSDENSSAMDSSDRSSGPCGGRRRQ